MISTDPIIKLGNLTEWRRRWKLHFPEKLRSGLLSGDLGILYDAMVFEIFVGGGQFSILFEVV